MARVGRGRSGKMFMPLWNRKCLRAVPACAVLILGACASNGTHDKQLIASENGWLKPTPLLNQRIEDEATRLPWTHGFERLESIRWFASVGEPAYPALLELAMHEREDVAAAALAAMGATRDSRLVQHIHDLPWPEGIANTDLGLERARTLLRLGDWGGIPNLIHGLEDERLYTRSLCLEALVEATGEDHGYDPRATEQKRVQAVNRWRTWWRARTAEGLVRAR